MLRAQTVYAVGGYAIPDFASPDPIGSSTPNSGVFTTLSASTSIYGPIPIGAGAGTSTMIGAANVNVTPVGNVGGGVDNLMTYTLPANSLSANGKGVRITAWGYAAANANAKQLVVMFGSTAVATLDLVVNETIYWKASAVVIRFASAVQSYFGEIDYRTAGVGRALEPSIEMGGATEDQTTAIVIKLTAAATDNNDIVQNGMLVEFIN